MKWIEARFHPGFEVDLTSWRAEIHSNGDVRQMVKFCRIPAPVITEVFEGTIRRTDLWTLRRMVHETDLSGIGEVLRSTCTEDVATQDIRVFSDDTVYHCGGSIYGLAYFQKEWDIPSDLNVQGLIDLWEKITSVLPYREEVYQPE